MEARVAAIARGEAKELVWLVEHPPLYTAGVSARASDLISPDRFPVFQVDRGGKHTYHGPGQRVVYVMFDLKTRQKDVRAFVAGLEASIIGALAQLGVASAVRSGRVGVWIEDAGEERKIAAIGLKIRRWISFHGISLNVSPDLTHFDGIVPCGLGEYGVTSLERLGLATRLEEADKALKASLEAEFGPFCPALPPHSY
jgi:lipoyl(octanoyl) transferase